MEKSKRIASLLKETFQLSPRLEQVTDIRENPSIPLKAILMSVFLMPFYGLTSLLSLDREARTRAFRTLVGSLRKMVASDSTVRRVLGWANTQQLCAFLLSFRLTFESEALLRRRLAEQGAYRRLGILDGSYMGGHWLVTLCLSGKINYPALVRRAEKQGLEGREAHRLIRGAKRLLGATFPDLWLLDGYYFNRPTFAQLRRRGAHLLIKVKNAEYRELLSDAANLFTHFGGDRARKGFDRNRLCAWSMQQTQDTFAGYPVQVVHLVETYPKRKRNRVESCWIVTTDLSLSLEEIRKAAHCRWQIENNVFKRLSHLSGTKRFYAKDPRAFFNLLRLFFAAIAVYDALLEMLRRDAPFFKSLLDGIKPTWRNVFSQIRETFAENTFCMNG